MRGRSLAAALALAFGATTLAVFVLVGSFLYLALEKQIREQDNLDIVLAARHARRLAEELDSAQGIRQHRDRLTSIVLGNEAMSTEVFDPDGKRAIEHNIAGALAVPDAASGPRPRDIAQRPQRGTNQQVAEQHGQAPRRPC
jgi:two-component system heavy metal sensor histidine kinase CusS